MKKFNAAEWVILMLAFSVSMAILMGIGGIVFKGSVNPNEGSVAVRNALLDLLKFIVGGIFGAGIFKTLNNDNGKSL